MRNACRKDDSRGGIRQCANVQCGKWEKFPREFAKCRRCRKAKYCGKECQSRAWSEGHRFWCCVKEEEPDGINTSTIVPILSVGTGQREREREREHEGSRNSNFPDTTAAGLALLDQMQLGSLGTAPGASTSDIRDSSVNTGAMSLSAPSRGRHGTSNDLQMQVERAYPDMPTPTQTTSNHTTTQLEASTSSQASRWTQNSHPPDGHTSLHQAESASTDAMGNVSAGPLDTMSVFSAPYLHLHERTGNFDPLSSDNNSITEIVGRTLSATDLSDIIRTFGIPAPENQTVAELVDEIE